MYPNFSSKGEMLSICNKFDVLFVHGDTITS